MKDYKETVLFICLFYMVSVSAWKGNSTKFLRAPPIELETRVHGFVFSLHIKLMFAAGYQVVCSTKSQTTLVYFISTLDFDSSDACVRDFFFPNMIMLHVIINI